MNDTPLPELSADASPEFIDPAGCKTWLDNLPLANVPAAQQELLGQMKELNRFPVRAATRLAVLEALREAVNFVQIEQAKRFTNRAQPLSEAEAAVLKQTVALWDEMRMGYMRCVEAARAGENGMRGQGALVCQRLLAYCGLKIFHHYRAYREISGEQWSALHRCYAAAEAMQVAEEPVKDYLNRDVHQTSPRIAYVRAALLGACQPQELSQRQLTFVTFLLERWGDKVEVSREPIAESEIAALVVDLDGEDCPGHPAGGRSEPSPGLRYIDVRRMAKSLRNRVALLRNGESPTRLALGEDCVQPSCEQLLTYLYRRWCLPRAPRAAERRGLMNPAQVTGELAAIHYQLTGKAFRQPASNAELSTKQREEIATFGRLSTRHEDDYALARGFSLEEWRLQDESLQGLKLMRPAGTPGKRYILGQVIALRTADAKSFMLGQVRWLMSNAAGDLYAGLRLLPGLPGAMAVRPTGLNAAKEQFIPALSLTAVAALNAPPSLLLPPGWYKPKRVIETYVETSRKAQLTELLERGSDFERVGYQVLPD